MAGRNKMTTYSQKNLTEYLNSVAAEKKISREALESKISLNLFQIVRGGPFLLPNIFQAEKDLKEFAQGRGYDAVVDIKKNFVFRYLGLEYKISATGVKFKEN